MLILLYKLLGSKKAGGLVSSALISPQPRLTGRDGSSSRLRVLLAKVTR